MARELLDVEAIAVRHRDAGVSLTADSLEALSAFSQHSQPRTEQLGGVSTPPICKVRSTDPLLKCAAEHTDTDEGVSLRLT